MVDPPVIGMMVPNDGKALEFGVPNLTEALTNFLVVAAGFLEWVAVAGLPGSLVTEEKLLRWLPR
jgi:hypothetical protein